MKHSQDNKGILSLLLKNSIVQFVAGTLSLFVILLASRAIVYKPIEMVLKSLGYGFFCYMTTPFIIYWLAYASQGLATAKKLIITVALVALYSYIIWDAYFFFRSAFAQLALGNPSDL